MRKMIYKNAIYYTINMAVVFGCIAGAIVKKENRR